MLLIFSQGFSDLNSTDLLCCLVPLPRLRKHGSGAAQLGRAILGHQMDRIIACAMNALYH